MNHHIQNPLEVITSEMIESLKRAGTATCANLLLKRGFKNAYLLGLSPINEEQEAIAGPAYTLRFIPAREDLDNMTNYARNDNLHRRAIEECPAGSILVIDTYGTTRSAAMGDMMALRLKYREVVGVVTDGGFRDTGEIRKIGLPCYQKESAPPATPISLHPVELNGPIGCAGVAIYPGDFIVGDSEGVVAIPAHLTAEIAIEAQAVFEYEEFAAAHLKKGRSLFGLFPGTEESQKEFKDWVAAGKPDI